MKYAFHNAHENRIFIGSYSSSFYTDYISIIDLSIPNYFWPICLRSKMKDTKFQAHGQLKKYAIYHFFAFAVMYDLCLRLYLFC